MPIYEKSTKELMKGFAATLKPGEIFTRSNAVDWFHQHYPKIRPATVGMHVKIMSVNSASRRHHPTIRPGSGHDLFYKLNHGQFRLWEPDKDGPANHPNVPIKAHSTGAEVVPDDEDDEVEDTPVDNATRDAEFAYEEDLRNYLAKNLGSVESGLRLYVDEDEEFNGLEFPVGGRRIDILALDQNGDFLVIELKVSRGHEKTIGQLARYMAWIKKNLAGDKKTRGMIVARNVSEDLKLAASIIPDVVLVEYQMALTFRALPNI